LEGGGEKAKSVTIEKEEVKMGEIEDFDVEKFKQVLHYIINRCGSLENVGKTVLYKILYFIDFDFYELYEDKLTRESYKRLEYGPAPIHFDEAIEKIVNDSVRLVGNQVKLAKVQLKLDFDQNLPNIHGDEQMLKQVFVNLILNAVDALSPGGSVKISIHKNIAQNFVSVEVKDNGSGIPEHIQSRIFEPFFTTKEQGKGTGLGLSVSRGIIRKLGGYIHLESSSGKGTAFTVSLPVTESPSEIMSK